MKSLLLGILFVVVALVVAAVVALAAVNLGADRRATKNSTVFGSVREIVVKPGRGAVEFVPGGQLIRIRERRHYVFSEPKLERARHNGVLTIVTKCDDLPDVVPCYSNLRVTVPPGVRIRVDGRSGDVDLRGVEVRRAHVQTRSGDVELGVGGHASLLWAHTDSGDVEIVAADARAVDAHSDSGDIDVDLATKPRRVAARSDSGDVQLTLPRGIYAVRAKADSGDVAVRGISRNRLSPSSIDARSQSGDVDVRPR
jgi:DUF4097 and DUF4098 domain-containing protein YvlB